MLTIGDLIKSRRKELHMTLADLSRASGIPKSTIQRWESGAVKSMGYDNLEKVADALDTTVGFLRTGFSVKIMRQERPKIFDSDVFRYFCEETGYKYATHHGPVQYYDKSAQEFAVITNKDIGEIIKQTAHYFAFLMHERSISFEELIRRDTEYDLSTRTPPRPPQE